MAFWLVLLAAAGAALIHMPIKEALLPTPPTTAAA